MKKKYRKGVFALIINAENKLLVIQKPSYQPTDWTIIGGGREANETGIENLYREIKEETDLDKKNLEIIGMAAAKHSYDYPENVRPTIHNGKYYGQSYDMFIVRFTGNLTDFHFLEEEIAHAEWVEVSKLGQYLHFPNQNATITKVLKELNICTSADVGQAKF